MALASKLWWGCKRKVAYSRHEANMKARQLNQFIRRGTKPFVPYPCAHGDHWHIGHDRTVSVKPHERY